MTPLRKRILALIGTVVGGATLGGCGPNEQSPSVVPGYMREGFPDRYKLRINLCESDTLEGLAGLKPDGDPSHVALLWTARLGAAPKVVDETGNCLPNEGCDAQPDISERGMPLGGRATAEGFEHLAVTQDGKTQILSEKREVVAFLGTIDTPDEAVLLLRYIDATLLCERANFNQVHGGYFFYMRGRHWKTDGEGRPCSEKRDQIVFVGEDGGISVRESRYESTTCPSGFTVGRMPRAAEPAMDQRRANREEQMPVSLGDYLARVAALEAAAVAAFEELAQELEHHEAPTKLIDRAQRAAREERRHTLLVGALARSFGAKRAIPVVAPRPLRSILDIALDNVSEGLTRETYGALLANYQACFAQDEKIRSVMELIAEDETGHAEFSLELHAWCIRRLSQNERAQVEARWRQAKKLFRPAQEEKLPQELMAQAGLPSPETSLRLYDGLFA